MGLPQKVKPAAKPSVTTGKGTKRGHDQWKRTHLSERHHLVSQAWTLEYPRIFFLSIALTGPWISLCSSSLPLPHLPRFRCAIIQLFPVFPTYLLLYGLNFLSKAQTQSCYLLVLLFSAPHCPKFRLLTQAHMKSAMSGPSASLFKLILCLSLASILKPCITVYALPHTLCNFTQKLCLPWFLSRMLSPLSSLPIIFGLLTNNPY